MSDPAGPPPGSTELIPGGERADRVLHFRLAVLEGPEAGTVWEAASDRCSVGSQPGNDLVIDDPTVSRFHCEIVSVTGGVRLRDLGSKNGTVLDGVRVVDAAPRHGSVIRLGRSVLRFEQGVSGPRMLESTRSEFGTLTGRSVAMRSAFAVLERAAASGVTILLEGESGTGKEEAARSIHAASARPGPFTIVDCGAIPGELMEAELFGHERGAFTGAGERRMGAFEAADGGTIFLDEIGELPLELQPKLLRALETREVRRLGATTHRHVDVRVLAATNRDLRAEVNDGTFRLDLYFRLAVVRIVLPPLRQRPEDLADLVERFLGSHPEGDPATRAALVEPAYLSELARAAWPGNVRELRNHLEQCLVLGQAAPPGGDFRPPVHVPVDLDVPLHEARRRLLDDFERRYVQALLEKHGGNVSAAARAAGIGRVSLYELMRRHGLM